MKVSQFYLFFLLVLCLWEVPKDCPGCSFCQRKNVKGAPDQPRRKTPTDSFVTSCVHLRLGRLYHEGEPWWTSNLRHTTGRCGKRLWPFQGGRDGIHKWVRSEACGAGVWIASDIFVNAYAFFLEQQPMQWEFSTVSLSQPLCQYFCRIYIYIRVSWCSWLFTSCICLEHRLQGANVINVPYHPFLPLSAACRRFFSILTILQHWFTFCSCDTTVGSRT